MGLNRWFLNVVGSVDAITAGVLLALALRPRPDTVDRRTRRGSHCGWRDHPSLPALLRRQARDIPVGDRWAGVASAHGDHDVGGVDGLGGQDLRRSVAMLLPAFSQA